MAKKNKLSGCIALLIFSMFLVTAGCSTKEEKVASFISRGDQLLEKGDATQALLEYKNALQIDPQSKGAILGLGNAFLALQQFQKAYSLFVSALAVNPDLDEVRLQTAWLLALGKQPERALKEIAQLKHPEEFQRRVDLIKAVAFFTLKRYQDVVDTLARVKGREDDKGAQMLLAQAFKGLKAWESMKKAAERWRALDPKDPAPYVFMARIAAESGDEARAAGELQKMAEADPKDPKRAVLRAQTLEALGLAGQAEAAYERLPDGADELQAKADYWTRRKNGAKARAALQKLVALNPENVNAVIRLAQLEADQNDRASAMALVDKTIKTGLKKPDREKMILAKASLEAQQAQWDEAGKLCRKVLDEDQGNVDAHLLLGKVLLGMNQPAEAEIHLSQAAASRPDDEQAQILLARSQFLSKKESLAVMTLQNALGANPKSTGLRAELIRYYLGKNETDRASEVIDKGLEIQPDNIFLLKTGGELEASLKDYSKAEQSLRRIIKIRPNLPTGYTEMGRLMLLQAKYSDAAGWFKQAMAREGGRQTALAGLVQTYMMQNDPRSALSLLKNESAKHPESALIQYYIGHTLEAAGDLKGAEKAFARAAELSPAWLAPYEGMAEVLLRQGKADEAISKIREAYRENPSSSLLFQLAMLYEYAGRYDDAIRVCSELVAKSAGGPEMVNNLAYLYAEHPTDAKSLAKAADLAARALAKQPRNPFFLDTAAWVAYKRGDLDAAWYDMQRALAHAPVEGLHCMHAAFILHKRGENKQAVEYLDKVLQEKTNPDLRKQARDLKKQWTARAD